METLRISEIYKMLHSEKTINLTPAFQRNAVWGAKDERELIDSIFRKYPVPEIMVHPRTPDSGMTTILDVVDGKQRINAVVSFIQHIHTNSTKPFKIKIDEEICDLHDLSEEDEKKILAAPNLGFEELPPKLKEFFLGSKFRVFELEGEDFNLTSLFKIFERINKTGKKLTPTEIRNAMFSGFPFMKIAKQLSEKKKLGLFLETNGVISLGQKQRMGDIGLILELLVLIKDGIQDKKKTLDAVIKGERSDKFVKKAAKDLISIINRISKIFPSLKETRFNKHSDFYSLVSALKDLEVQGYSLADDSRYKDAEWMLRELGSKVDELRDDARIGKPLPGKNKSLEGYFLATQHSTDTKDFRLKRMNYIKEIIGPIFGKNDRVRIFSEEQRRILWHSAAEKKCIKCNKNLSWEDLTIDHKQAWSRQGETKLHNAQIMCRSCNSSKGKRRA
ncbi:MAG: DUF262 domain-containing protein [Candidatus Paceibacterota bacterium]